MRHRKSGAKLNRTSSHREAMFKNMLTSLFKHERIKTTEAKAKELRKWADKLIVLAKKGDLSARRKALSLVRDKDIVHKLFKDVNERFSHTDSGYTRIFKIGTRKGDIAKMSLISLFLKDKQTSKKPKKYIEETDLKKTESDITKEVTDVVDKKATDNIKEEEIAEDKEEEIVEETTKPVEEKIPEETTKPVEEKIPEEEAKPENK